MCRSALADLPAMVACVLLWPRLVFADPPDNRGLSRAPPFPSFFAASLGVCTSLTRANGCVSGTVLVRALVVAVVSGGPCLCVRMAV